MNKIRILWQHALHLWRTRRGLRHQSCFFYIALQYLTTNSSCTSVSMLPGWYVAR